MYLNAQHFDYYCCLEFYSICWMYHFLAIFLFLFSILIVLNTYVFDGLIHEFQNKALPAIMHRYENLLRWALSGWKPVGFLLDIWFIDIFYCIFWYKKSSGCFFPKGDPNFIYVYLKMPVGTSVDYTDSLTKILEKRVINVVEPNGKPNPIVESVISNVAVGATDPTSGDNSTQPKLGRVQVSFVEYENEMVNQQHLILIQ